MFLNYFALGVLIFVFLVIFYGIIAIHDIPYLIAKKAQPSPCRRYSYGGLGKPVYPACYLAVPVDLGDALSTGARLGHAVACYAAREND